MPLIGGAEFHLHYLTQNLIEQGWEVEIVTGLADDATVEYQDICPVHRLPHAVGRRALPYFFVWLARFIRMFPKFDVIHVHHTSFLSFVAVIAGWLTGKRIVVTLHGLGVLDSGVGRCPIRLMYRWLSMKGAGRIIATSEEMTAVAVRFVARDRVVEVTNGVDTKRFSATGDRSFEHVGETLRLATLRRMNPKNGVHFVIDALGLARDTLRFHLRMAGDGPLRPAIEARIAEFGLVGRATFEGFLNHDQVKGVLDETDLAMFLSTAESTSLAALECMAMGCIVVCSNAGAFPLFVRDRETGFIIDLFEQGQSDYAAPLHLEAWQNQRIAETLIAIQAMPAAELRAISEAAQAYVRAYFDWSVITANTVAQAYQPLIKRRAG